MSTANVVALSPHDNSNCYDVNLSRRGTEGLWSTKLLTSVIGRRKLIMSCGIFHRRRRKIVALIRLNARSGIAAAGLLAALALAP
jgi:hypothetical protein